MLRPHGNHRLTDCVEVPADHAVSGPVFRFMWDQGVRVLLWDAEGLLADAYEGLDVRAQALVKQLEREVGPRLGVRYHPW